MGRSINRVNTRRGGNERERNTKQERGSKQDKGSDSPGILNTVPHGLRKTITTGGAQRHCGKQSGCSEPTSRGIMLGSP